VHCFNAPAQSLGLLPRHGGIPVAHKAHLASFLFRKRKRLLALLLLHHLRSRVPHQTLADDVSAH
jgi:hypothetical protein